jgi:hypothetical protein
VNDIQSKINEAKSAGGDMKSALQAMINNTHLTGSEPISKSVLLLYVVLYDLVKLATEKLSQYNNASEEEKNQLLRSLRHIARKYIRLREKIYKFFENGNGENIPIVSSNPPTGNKPFLTNKESYISKDVEKAIAEMKRIHATSNGNEQNKIAQMKAILENPKVKEYFASLRVKRALLLREFELLNRENSGNINQNVKNRANRLDAFMDLLDTMKKHMNNISNDNKKKKFLRDLKIISTIHGNLQRDLYPIMNGSTIKLSTSL